MSKSTKQATERKKAYSSSLYLTFDKHGRMNPFGFIGGKLRMLLPIEELRRRVMELQ